MAIIQLNTCIKKDLAVDYYSIVKFLEKVCDDIENIKLNHVEINSGYSIYNLYTLYSVTPCIIDENNTYSISSLLILIDNESRNVIHCIESTQSFIDIDKYFEMLLKTYFKINIDNDNYLKTFIKNNIQQKKSSIINNIESFTASTMQQVDKTNTLQQMPYSNKLFFNEFNKSDSCCYFHNMDETTYKPEITTDKKEKQQHTACIQCPV